MDTFRYMHIFHTVEHCANNKQQIERYAHVTAMIPPRSEPLLHERARYRPRTFDTVLELRDAHLHSTVGRSNLSYARSWASALRGVH